MTKSRPGHESEYPLARGIVPGQVRRVTLLGIPPRVLGIPRLFSELA